MDLEKLYRDFGYWKVQEELVKANLASVGKQIAEALSKKQEAGDVKNV